MIALVPGLAVGQRYFDRLAAELDDELLRPAVRRPLPVPELAAELSAQLVGPALVVANSLGCQVVAELAVRRPELVEALVLVGPTVDPHARSAPRHVARFIADAWFEPPRLTAIVARDYLATGPISVARQARFALAHRIEDLLPAIEHEAVVVRGAHDPICSEAWAREAASLLPRGRLVTIAGAAHATHYSHPREVAELVKSLRGTRAGAR